MKWFFYGKRKFKRSKDRIKFLEKSVLFIFFGFILLILMIAFLIYENYPRAFTNYNENPLDFELKEYPQIVYDKLSENKTLEVDKALDDLRVEYLENVKQITFTSNKSSLPCFFGTCIGVNNRRGKVYVYTGIYFRDTLCHELIHTNWEGNHKVVYNLGFKEVCYG